jgi:hypothetical protein
MIQSRARTTAMHSAPHLDVLHHIRVLVRCINVDHICAPPGILCQERRSQGGGHRERHHMLGQVQVGHVAQEASDEAHAR